MTSINIVIENFLTAISIKIYENLNVGNYLTLVLFTPKSITISFGVSIFEKQECSKEERNS